MTLWRLFYHVVFATDGRHPVLRGDLRGQVGRLLWSKADELGCLVHAVHVQPEHVHLALSIPPSRAVAMVVAQLKGVSSHLAERELPAGETFAWQRGYGVFSFGERNLPDMVRYIRDQDRRHASGQLWDALERTMDDAADRLPDRTL